MSKVRNAVALVTGAAGGIGAAIADELAGRGATVVRSDLRGGAVDLDVTDAQAVEAVVARVIDEHGRIDIAVTAAGVGVAGPVEAIEGDEWHRTVDVSIYGTVHVVRAVYPHLIAQRRGHLLLVASLAGLTPTPLLTAYAMTKYATVGLARSLRLEAARHGVGVSALCPGPVNTPLLDAGGGRIDVRRYLTDVSGPAMEPTRVARAAVRAIERNRAIAAPGRARLLALGTRMSSRAADHLLTSAMKRELRRNPLAQQ